MRDVGRGDVVSGHTGDRLADRGAESALQKAIENVSKERVQE